MSNHKYEIIIYWSQPDEAYIAEVPELAGCAADGESYQEALANAEVVIDEWIETAQLKGRPIPQPKVYNRKAILQTIGKETDSNPSGLENSNSRFKIVNR